MSDIKTIKVSFTHTPEDYLEYCEEEEFEPTQEDFEEYIIENYFEEWCDPIYIKIERIGD